MRLLRRATRSRVASRWALRGSAVEEATEEAEGARDRGGSGPGTVGGAGVARARSPYEAKEEARERALSMVGVPARAASTDAKMPRG